ncbi:hybrid sensor histidine kinase/response regulator [Chamaesiphon polymorphus]|uniref:Circadian input-output histidine kinase CikA n=1 Tax=Chamaesiphon polymorphus CCALA 037 TaxID=2107692 RepID=A0A2T1GAG3_9CYAN|nr:hybrid sensor histidine kinase/response regulator [Chamaesiphon polymorphus]PSB54225.1 hybrid sensor histidine kinase/response regulator [Chamaesiphon polymorphus CCALA 037]
MQIRKRNCLTNISNTILFLALLTVAIVGGVSFFSAREALKEASFNQLKVAATLKEAEINRWFEERERDFAILSQSPDTQANFKLLLRSEVGTTDYRSAQTQLVRHFNNVTKLKPSFKRISLLNNRNRIILSTDPTLLGKDVVTANLTSLEGIEPGRNFTPILYRSPITDRPAITLAAPMRDPAGRRQGEILADLNFEGIAEVVGKRAGLGKTGETYLVGSLVREHTLISREPLDLSLVFSPQLHSQGIDRAMQGQSGADLYQNSTGVPVLGVYRWLKHQNLVLLAEMSQDEAFSPARQLATTIITVGLISTVGLFIGVRWLTQQLKVSQQQLKTYSQRLEKKAEEAEIASQAKGTFLANMSHEFRTPLNAILGFTQIMARDATATPGQLEYLSIISRSGAHLLTLINDVLSMAQLEAGRATLSESSFDLNHLLGALKEMLQIEAQAKGLVLVVERSPDVPRYIHTDEHKLRQVLINLVGNAIKFTTTGRVSLRVSKKQPSPDRFPASSQLKLRSPREWLDFEIEDSGPGIPAVELDRLFDPFFQAAKLQKSPQGSGLGLTISQEFVNLMDGEIGVRQTSPRGTTFGFTIQVASVISAVEQAKSPDRYMVTKLTPDRPPARILIVEDSWENRRLLVDLLAGVGFEVRAAENGREGVEIWSSWHPPPIWMDMRMPLLDGYAATRQIRRQEAKRQSQGRLSQRTKIIALTASVFEEERTAILAAGCDDLVHKPFQEAVIFEKMANYLGITYQYVEKFAVASCQVDSTLKPALASEHLEVMPQDWIVALHQAALRVDADIILELAEQIPTANLLLAIQLKDLTQSFCFEEIMELTQPYIGLAE